MTSRDSFSLFCLFIYLSDVTLITSILQLLAENARTRIDSAVPGRNAASARPMPSTWNRTARNLVNSANFFPLIVCMDVLIRYAYNNRLVLGFGAMFVWWEYLWFAESASRCPSLGCLVHSNDRDDRFIRKNVKFSEIDNARGAFRCMFRPTMIYTLKFIRWSFKLGRKTREYFKKRMRWSVAGSTFESSDNFDCRVAPWIGIVRWRFWLNT